MVLFLQFGFCRKYNFSGNFYALKFGFLIGGRQLQKPEKKNRKSFGQKKRPQFKTFAMMSS